MSVYETSRQPDFQKDIATYGKIGENFFMNTFGKALTSRGEQVYDVSNRLFWQKIDVDLVISKGGKPLVDSFEAVSDDSFLKIEIKVDTRAAHTGNLPFEIISHGGWGWGIKSHADKVFVVLCEDGIQNGMIYAHKAYLIDMLKWKVFASYSSNTFRNAPNRIVNEEIYDFLCKIEHMKKVPGLILGEIEINGWI